MIPHPILKKNFAQVFFFLRKSKKVLIIQSENGMRKKFIPEQKINFQKFSKLKKLSRN